MAKFDVAKTLEKLRRHGWDLVNDDGKLVYRVLRKGVLYVPKELKEELDAHRKEVKEYLLGKPTGEIASREEPYFGDRVGSSSPFDDPKVLHWIANPTCPKIILASEKMRETIGLGYTETQNVYNERMHMLSEIESAIETARHKIDEIKHGRVSLFGDDVVENESKKSSQPPKATKEEMDRLAVEEAEVLGISFTIPWKGVPMHKYIKQFIE